MQQRLIIQGQLGSFWLLLCEVSLWDWLDTWEVLVTSLHFIVAFEYRKRDCILMLGEWGGEVSVLHHIVCTGFLPQVGNSIYIITFKLFHFRVLLHVLRLWIRANIQEIIQLLLLYREVSPVHVDVHFLIHIVWCTSRLRIVLHVIIYYLKDKMHTYIHVCGYTIVTAS